MTFTTKQDKVEGQTGRVKNIVIARIPIIGGSSREEVRDALGTGSLVRLRLDIPKEEKSFPLLFLRDQWLEVEIRGLVWKDWSSRASAKPMRCILLGEFGPLTDGFCDTVYWGEFRSLYDTSKRNGVITMRFSWESRLADTSF